MLLPIRKAQPTAGDVHVNSPLTNISIAFLQQATNFIARRVFPIVPVAKQSDRYFIYNRSDWNRQNAQKRAPGTETAGGGWAIDNTPNYFADVWGIHKDVDDQIRANSDSPLAPDRDATEWVTQQLLLRREKEWATNYMATGIWTGDQTGVAAAPAANQFLQWNDTASTPIEDITAQVLVIAKRTGFKPNKLVLGPEVFDKLRHHADVLDRYKHTQRAVITSDLLAPLFDVDEVLVPMAVEETAAEGAAESFGFIHGKSALLVYAAPRPSLMHPSGGYTFSWTGLLGAGQEGNRIKRFRMEGLSSDRVEGEMAFSQKLVAAECGVFFATAVA